MAKRSKDVTRSECAKLLGVKVRQFDNLVTEGLPRIETPNGYRYDPEKSLAWYTARQEARRAPTNGGRKHAEDRLATIKARLAELDLVEREGSLVDVDFAVRHHQLFVERIRTKLTPFPGKLAGRVLGLRDYGEAVARIKPLWDELLADLAKTGKELALELGKRNGNGNGGPPK